MKVVLTMEVGEHEAVRSAREDRAVLTAGREDGSAGGIAGAMRRGLSCKARACVDRRKKEGNVGTL